MRSGRFFLSIVVACCTTPFLHAQAPARGVTAEEVQEAIDSGTRYLKKVQQPDGDWPDQPHYAGGLTPLCTLALLHCGYLPGDPSVDKAIAQMLRLEPHDCYTVALQTMVLCYVDAKKYSDFIKRNVRWLEKRQHELGPDRGMWAIPEKGTENHTDNSMTHFAMLALYEAEKAGFAISEGV